MIFDTVLSLRPSQLNRHQKIIYSASLLLLFLALFDGFLAYILPIKITGLGFSATSMGLILASSNIFGLIFDFVLARYLTNTNYRRLFLIVFGLCFIYPLILWSAKTVPVFMMGMAVWGLYGDLNNFAVFDFVSRRTKSIEHSQSFGILDIFKSLGYLISPIIAGLIVVNSVDFFPFSISISFLIIALIFYLILLQMSPKRDLPGFDHSNTYRKYNFFKEFHIIKSVGITLFPVLLFNTLLHIYDGAIWTIGPIFGSTMDGFADFGGFLMTAYILPSLLVGWYIGPITARFGKKRTAFVSFLISSLFLMPISFTSNPFIILLLIFLSSIGSAMSWPAIRGAYADYISESNVYSKEIESLNDFTNNLGYIIGPAMAGILSDIFGMRNIFMILAIVSIFTVGYLIMVTPKHIRVVVHR